MKIIGRLKEILNSKMINYRVNKLVKYWDKQNYEKVAKMFKTHKDYRELKIDSFPFLYFMIGEGKKEPIDLFLKKNQFKNEILASDDNAMNVNPIGFAFLQKKYEIVELLEKYGGNIFSSNSEAQNLLHLAAIYRREQPFKEGLVRGIDINMADKYGNTPFHYACRVASVEMIASCIAAKAKKLQNQNHQYPIHMVIESGNLTCLNLLIDDLNGTYPKFHPIHSAARSGNLDMVQQILKRKPISINFTDFNGLTPLHHAISVEDKHIFDLLVSKPKIQISKRDNFSNTPLHIAFLNENTQMIRKLIEMNAELDTLNEDSMSPVDYGISSDKKEIHSILRGIDKKKSKRMKDWVSNKY